MSNEHSSKDPKVVEPASTGDTVASTVKRAWRTPELVEVDVSETLAGTTGSGSDNLVYS